MNTKRHRDISSFPVINAENHLLVCFSQTRLAGVSLEDDPSAPISMTMTIDHIQSAFEKAYQPDSTLVVKGEMNMFSGFEHSRTIWVSISERLLSLAVLKSTSKW